MSLLRSTWARVEATSLSPRPGPGGPCSGRPRAGKSAQNIPILLKPLTGLRLADRCCARIAWGTVLFRPNLCKGGPLGSIVRSQEPVSGLPCVGRPWGMDPEEDEQLRLLRFVVKLSRLVRA